MKLRRSYLSILLVYCFHRILSMTWKYEVHGDPDVLAQIEATPGIVYGHLHQQEWALLAYWRNTDMNVLISLSSDGNAMARLVSWFGYRVTRGASSKGGAAGLLKLIKTIKGQNFQKATSIAVDGPRGPFAIPKKGIVTLARKTNAPLLLVAAQADRYWELSKSWSKPQIPKFFSTIHLRFSQIPVEDSQSCADEAWPDLSRQMSDHLCYYLRGNQ